MAHGPPQSFTPHNAAAQSRQDSAEANLKALGATLVDVAQNYDAEYADLSKTMADIADITEEVNHIRIENINALKDDIQKWVEHVQAAKETASDTSSLERFREEVKVLQEEKQRLVQQILEGKEETETLKEKLDALETQMNKVKHAHKSIKEKQSTQVPTFKYLLKVLQRVSTTVISSGRSSPHLEGFVSGLKTDDVHPFRYDREVPQYDRVNALWDMICHEE